MRVNSEEVVGNAGNVGVVGIDLRPSTIQTATAAIGTKIAGLPHRSVYSAWTDLRTERDSFRRAEDMKVETSCNSKATCQVVGPGAEFVSKQGNMSAPGIYAESVGALRINLQIVTIPPGWRAKAHKHDGHETALYILSGESGMWYGERLEEHLIAKAGDFVYIPASMPHLPYNLSETEAGVAVISRTDPNEQESVVLLPELDGIHPGEPRPPISKD
jgi:uncharacterized RmlC-like cupin family protein